jgi:hypothetical protein
MKAAEAEAAELKAQLASRTTTATDNGETATAPAMDPQVKTLLDNYIQENLGMDLRTAAQALKTIPETSKAAQLERWNRLATSNKLDPNDKKVQRLVAGLCSQGMDPEDAVKEIAGMVKPAAPEPPDMEHEGLTRHMVKEDARAWTPAEARALAAKGIRAPQRSITEVFQEADARRARLKR